MPGLRLMLGVATGWIGHRLAVLLTESGADLHCEAGQPIMWR